MVSSIARDVRPEPEDASDPVLQAAQFEVCNRLIDSLVHDARNPLNALSINLEVLTEKLKGEDGEVPPKQLKNLKAMRDQIGRVDAILREYAEFIAPRFSGGAVENLSALLTRAVAVLGHEGRVKRLQCRVEIAAELSAKVADPGALRFLLVKPILRAIARAPEASELTITLQAEGGSAVFQVTDAGAEGDEPFEHALPAIAAAANRLGVVLRVRGGELRVAFPLL